MRSTPTPQNRVAAIALASAMVLLLAGCGSTEPDKFATTDVQYDLDAVLNTYSEGSAPVAPAGSSSVAGTLTIPLDQTTAASGLGALRGSSARVAFLYYLADCHRAPCVRDTLIAAQDVSIPASGTIDISARSDDAIGTVQLKGTIAGDSLMGDINWIIAPSPLTYYKGTYVLRRHPH